MSDSTSVTSQDACPHRMDVHRLHDGELSEAQAREIRLHLNGCADCAAERAQLRALSRLVGSVEPPATVELEQRLMETLERERGAQWNRWMTKLTWAAAAVLVLGLGLMWIDPFGEVASRRTQMFFGVPGSVSAPTGSDCEDTLAMAQWIREDLSPRTLR